MPAEGNTISYKLDVMCFCSYFLNKLSPHLPLNSLKALVSWARHRKGVKKKYELCSLEPSSEQGFFPKPLPGSSSPAGLRPSWTEIYILMKHRVILKGKMGEFSIPMMQSQFPQNFWCSWTILAGPQSHAVVYVSVFKVIGNDDCGPNPDKTVFQGVSPVAESSMVHAY